MSIDELYGQNEALRHLLVTIVNLLGPDARESVIAATHVISTSVGFGAGEVQEAFLSTLDRVREDVAEPLFGND